MHGNAESTDHRRINGADNWKHLHNAAELHTQRIQQRNASGKFCHLLYAPIANKRGEGREHMNKQ